MEKNKKIKTLSVMTYFWDYVPLLNVFDRMYSTKFISFYEPKMTGKIDRKKIIIFGERSKTSLLWPIKLLTRTCKLFSIIKKTKPNLIISQHDDTNTSIIPTIILIKKILRRRIKFIAFLHRGIREYEDKKTFIRLSSFAIRHLYGLYDVVITVSEGNKIALEKKFKFKNIKVIYNPISIKDIKKSSEEKPDEKLHLKNKFVFLTIGRLSLQKGQWHLIKAFKIVHDENPHSVLVVLGDGEIRKDIEQLIADLDLKDSVILMGRVDNVFKYIKRSDCFVLTSLWESFGQVLVEAMALNKPVISTDCEYGPREILSPRTGITEKINYPLYAEHGILTSPFSSEDFEINAKITKEHVALAEVMKKLIGDKKLRDKYSHGYNRAKDFDEYKIEKLFKKLITR